MTFAGGDVAVERATVWLYCDNAKYTLSLGMQKDADLLQVRYALVPCLSSHAQEAVLIVKADGSFTHGVEQPT